MNSAPKILQKSPTLPLQSFRVSSSVIHCQKYTPSPKRWSSNVSKWKFPEHHATLSPQSIKKIFCFQLNTLLRLHRYRTRRKLSSHPITRTARPWCAVIRASPLPSVVNSENEAYAWPTQQRRGCGRKNIHLTSDCEPIMNRRHPGDS